MNIIIIIGTNTEAFFFFLTHKTKKFENIFKTYFDKKVSMFLFKKRKNIYKGKLHVNCNVNKK